MAVILIVEDDVYPRRRGDACCMTGNTINDKAKAVFVEGTHFLQKLYIRNISSRAQLKYCSQLNFESAQSIS